MNDSPIYERIERGLSERKEQAMFRSVKSAGSRYSIDLSNNSYLSLHSEPQVIKNAREITGNILCGNLASRLVSEHSALYSTLESEISSWEQTESAMVFTSGYTANVGLIQAICTRETEVFCDRLNHASIYDGIALSGCKLVRYRHNDMKDLQFRLDASDAVEKLIITDTVFSMDGDKALLEDIATLARRYKCMVMVDEAHATGIFGEKGTGVVEESGTASQIDIRMGTLSKALAGLGGYFAGSKLLRDYFVNYSRSFIYSTGLPHASLAFTIAAIKFIRQNPGLGSMLLSKADHMRKRIQQAGYSTMNSTTQIIPCLVSSKTEALELSDFLASQGINAPAIRPPTVPEGTARIRISCHLGINMDDEDRIIDQLTQWKSKHA